MSKAGKKIIRGAKEALAVARGEKLPAKATMFGWATWSPFDGLGRFIYANKTMAKGCSRPGTIIVRVKVETQD